MKICALAIICSSVLLTGCSDDSPTTVTNSPAAIPPVTLNSYQVTLQNLTAGQSFSAPVLLLHSIKSPVFEEGSPSSIGLEDLAETGSTQRLLQELSNAKLQNVFADTSSIRPMQSRSYTLIQQQASERFLSVATMLGRTNDAFTGSDTLNLADLRTGQTMTVDMPAWDAGTEANTERAETLGSSGFNPTRDDQVNAVTIHAGVLSNVEDPASALAPLQRFDNPVLRIRITRQ